MGNVQTASVPSQILPTESYIQDVAELRFIKSLGATRFMKTVCVESTEVAVAKVFILNNVLTHLNHYVDQIHQLRKRLKESPNCLPYTKTFKNDKCIILHRSYRKYTLYERLSTRPFLIDIEKRWIAFQLLKALNQCRISSVRHGDIKSQNVVITSDGWVQLTDFAPFKPAFIPYDNPSTFTFFFDTSRRRTCYIAPERFKKAEDIVYFANEPNGFVNVSDGITDSMDIFAMGCVLVELLTDGRHVAFNLSQGVDYTRMDDIVTSEYLDKLLSVCPEEFRQLLAVMLDRNPERRREEFSKMNIYESGIFPAVFEDFLYRYVKDLRSVRNPDELVLKLFVEYPNYKNIFEQDASNSVTLLINVLAVNLRACRRLTSKMDGVSLLALLSKKADPTVIADRIIPYLVNMLNDPVSQVRSEAIFVITEILESMVAVPYDESRLLVDFIFPCLKQVTEDSSDLVKLSLASCLGRLAKIAVTFFNAGCACLNDKVDITSSLPIDESCEEMEGIISSERKALQKTVGELFMNLCGSSNRVREALFDEQNLLLLCEYMDSANPSGREYDSNGDILLHMIALLNESDWKLRAAFFQSCPAIATFANKIRNANFMPFLQQGLQDTDEFVTYAALNCFYHLCNRNLLEKPIILKLLPDIVPFLVHPNLWFRREVVNILSVLDSIFTVADVYCKLVPRVAPFLRKDLIICSGESSIPIFRLNDRAAFFSVLVNPISRQIWNLVAKCDRAADLLKEMEDRRTMDKLGGGRHSFFSSGISPESPPRRAIEIVRTDDIIEYTIQRLKKLGLTEEVEDFLVAFQNVFKKVEVPKKPSLSHSPTKMRSKIPLHRVVQRITFDLEDGQHKISKATAKPSSVIPENTGSHRLTDTFSHKQARYREQKRILSNPKMSGSTSIPTIRSAPILSDGSSLLPLTNRRPEIRLVSHIHEHSGAVLQLSALPRKECFTSCSADKTVKLWYTSQSGVRNFPTNIASETLTYSHQINSISFLQHDDLHLALGSAHSELIIQDLTRSRPLHSYSVDREVDGPIVRVESSEHLIHVLTHHGGIYCFDLRTPAKSRSAFELDPIFLRRQRNSSGLITSFSVDPVNQHWMILTSTSPNHNMLLYDLRFVAMEASRWTHPNSDKCAPFRSWSYVSESNRCNQIITNSSKEGELSLWDLCSQDQTDIFWTGSQKPFSYVNDLITTSVVSVPHMNGVFTGDSEGSLRFWSLDGHCHRSNYLCGPHRKYANHWNAIDRLRKEEKQRTMPTVNYSLTENASIRIQVENRTDQSLVTEHEPQSVPLVSDAHRTTITDIVNISTDHFVSSSSDGVIKLWKIIF